MIAKLLEEALRQGEEGEDLEVEGGTELPSFPALQKRVAGPVPPYPFCFFIECLLSLWLRGLTRATTLLLSLSLRKESCLMKIPFCPDLPGRLRFASQLARQRPAYIWTA